mmetsp:Transcript_40230/g.89310  ORF Transcript_40230/g.89310 Transcript_40230/m.89310 type:complete len:347 (+) Transcript_40230:29-1069(+)
MLHRNIRAAASRGHSVWSQFSPFSSSRTRPRARSQVVANAAGQDVAKPDIKQLAKMAQIAVTEQEVADWEPKINSIVDWFGQLQQVDVSNVQPAIHAAEDTNVLRRDEPRSYFARAELLAQAPATEKNYVKVPKVGTGSNGEAASGSAAAPATAAAPAAAPTAAAGDIKAAADAGSADMDALHALDIRVGKIVSCERHPDAESLYVEKIDVGEAEPRTIVSGLVKYVPLEQMQNRMVVVLCNLKPRNMRGIKSFGMLLAASDAPHVVVEPLVPPQGAQPGDRIWFGDMKEQAAPATPNVVDKKKLWEAVQPSLGTAADCTATWKGKLMNTPAGPIKSATLVDARIA